MEPVNISMRSINTMAQTLDGDRSHPSNTPPTRTTGKIVTDGFFRGHGEQIEQDMHGLYWAMHRRYFHGNGVDPCRRCPLILETIKPWLAERTEHRRWQREQGIPSGAKPVTKFTTHHQLLQSCPCHLPDCLNVILAEFDANHLLFSEDKMYYERAGRRSPLWLPLIGPRLTVRRLAKLEKHHRGNYMTVVWGRYYDFDTDPKWTKAWKSIKTWAEDYSLRIRGVKDMETLLPMFRRRADPSEEQLYLKRIPRPNNTVLWKTNPGWALLPPLVDGGDIQLTSPWERCALEWDSETTRLWKQDGMWLLIFLKVIIWILTGGWVWQRWLRDRRARQVADEDDVD